MSSLVQFTSLSHSERIPVIDALRGFALLGLLLVHRGEYFDLYWINPQPSKVHDVIFFLFAGKSYAIFALLFGLSFYIIMESEKRKGNSGNGRFLWRLAVLFIIGYLHCLLYAGDILQVIAILGVSLVIGNQLKTLWILCLSIAFFINGYLIYHFFAAIYELPHANDQPLHWSLSSPLFQVWSSGTFFQSIIISGTKGFISKWYFYIESGRLVQMLGLFMAGLWLGRTAIFRNIPMLLPKIKWTFLITVIIASALYVLKIFLPSDLIQKEGMANYYLGQLLDGYFSLAMVIVWVHLFFIASQLKWGQPIIEFLAPAGRMSLTIYVMQSVICIPIYFGFGIGWYASCTQVTSILLGLLIFISQVAFAHFWFQRFYYGPLEWVWRTATSTGNVKLVRQD